MSRNIPHLNRLQQEIREVFLNAQFVQPAGCLDPVAEAEVCPGYSLVVHYDGGKVTVMLAEDWTGVNIYTETHLRVDNPDWGRFRRWLWDSCYVEVAAVVSSICQTLGVSVAWPEPVEVNGRKHFSGREPVETVDDLFGHLTCGECRAHIITGNKGSGRTTLALQVAVEAVKWGQTVLFCSMEETVVSLVQRLSSLGENAASLGLQGLTLTSMTGQGISYVLQQCEGAIMDKGVLVLDSTFVNFGDQPKRLAIKTGTEVFVTQQAARGQTERTQVKDRAVKTVDAVYWSTAKGLPFKVLKHPRCGGARILHVPL